MSKCQMEKVHKKLTTNDIKVLIHMRNTGHIVSMIGKAHPLSLNEHGFCQGIGVHLAMEIGDSRESLWII